MHQTRRFVQRVGGLCFLKELKMNTKLHKSQFDILILFFASLRLCGIKISVYSCLLVVQPSLFPGKPAISRNLFLRNKPNFNDLNITVTSYGTTAYNDLHPKSQNGTNPNKANQSQFQSLRSLRQKNGKYLAKNKKMKSKANFRQSRRSFMKTEPALKKRKVKYI